MPKFTKGDRVIVLKGQHEGLKGTVTNPRHGVISASDWPMVEILIDHDGAPGAVRGFIYEDDRDLGLADDPYEYTYEKSFGKVKRRIDACDWVTKESAFEVLKTSGSRGDDPTWGSWTAKVVKRKKAGPIEDA